MCRTQAHRCRLYHLFPHLCQRNGHNAASPCCPSYAQHAPFARCRLASAPEAAPTVTQCLRVTGGVPRRCLPSARSSPPWYSSTRWETSPRAPWTCCPSSARLRTSSAPGQPRTPRRGAHGGCTKRGPGGDTGGTLFPLLFLPEALLGPAGLLPAPGGTEPTAYMEQALKDVPEEGRGGQRQTRTV